MAAALALAAATAAAVPPRVAVVTGASRGIGRGIAIELGRAGYTVYALGRTSRARTGQPAEPLEQSTEGIPADLTVEGTAEAISAAGGLGIPLQCDVLHDENIDAAVEAVRREHGRLDVLVCSAYTVPEGPLRDDFWKQGMDMWDACHAVGLRSVYSTCRAATPLMIETAQMESATDEPKPPLIALVSSFGGKSYTFNVAYGVGKAGVDRLALDMSVQLRKVWPGFDSG